MNNRWNDLTKEETLLNIISYLEEQLSLAERTALSRDVYDKGSWPYFQADCNGQQRILRKILDFIK